MAAIDRRQAVEVAASSKYLAAKPELRFGRSQSGCPRIADANPDWKGIELQTAALRWLSGAISERLPRGPLLTTVENTACHEADRNMVSAPDPMI
jgi:hypothetical protein